MTDQPIVPFWQRLSEITLYPAKPAAMITIGVLALARLLGLLPGLAGWLLDLLVTVALYRFAFEVLRATANGRMEPPEGMGETAQSSGWLAIWLQLIFIVAAVLLVVLLGWIGHLGGCAGDSDGGPVPVLDREVVGNPEEVLIDLGLRGRTQEHRRGLLPGDGQGRPTDPVVPRDADLHRGEIGDESVGTLGGLHLLRRCLEVPCGAEH